MCVETENKMLILKDALFQDDVKPTKQVAKKYTKLNKSFFFLIEIEKVELKKGK